MCGRPPSSRCSRRASVRVWLAALLTTLGASAAVAAPADSGRSGRELYLETCAACHGADGRGEPARDARYPKQPPDFTDCNFATREANSDWLAVSHVGGPARGFDRRMPAFGPLLTDTELVRVLDYMRTFCRDPAWPRGELNLPRAQRTEKAYPEDEAVIAMAATDTEVTTELSYERRFGARTQIEVVAPLVFAEQDDGDWSGGIGDLAFAIKRVLAASLARGAILSGALEIVTPTGRTDRGFGGGTTVFEGFLAYGQILPANAFLQLQVGGGVAYDRDFPDEVFARGALGDQIVPVPYGRMWAPMVEVTAVRELDEGAATEVDVIPELQVTLSMRHHIRANVGVSIPVTEREGRATAVLAYLLWDWFDGGLLEGW